MSKIKESNTKLRKRSRFTQAACILGVVLVVSLIVDLVGIGGNIRFYAKWIECGRKPVIKFIKFGSVGPDYGPSFYVDAPSFSLFRFSPDQFCTPIEAERAGLSADKNTWSFPNLEAAGEKNPFLRDLNL